MKNKYMELAKVVLEAVGIPMSYMEIWNYAQINGQVSKLGLYGKTPHASLGALLYTSVKSSDSIFAAVKGTRPIKFYLKNFEYNKKSPISPKPIDVTSILPTIENESYKERDLHPILAYFASSNPAFNRGRTIHVKTIYHEKSTKQKGYKEWTHPDMVGFYFPLDDWNENVIKFNDMTDRNSLRLFSFELKKRIDKSNYRESFFQAVSNSSWAHEGYLVAAEIEEDDDLIAELGRLSASFKIGIIHLKLDEIDNSKVLFPSYPKEILDWESINKLISMNVNFEKFISDVSAVCISKRHNKDLFDKVPPDIENYIETTINVKQTVYRIIKNEEIQS